MRFKITLELLSELKGCEIPINYQYELSSAIYHILSKGDANYAEWLHNNGFQEDKKRFKLFTFSRLIAPYRIDKKRERLILKSNTIVWYITFLPEKATKDFIQGIFQDQQFEISDSISGTVFKIKEIQLLSKLNYTPDTIFETMSPICISHRNEQGKADYLSPVHPLYTQGILTGLLARYQAFTGTKFKGDPVCNLHVLSEPKSSLITIKKGTVSETRVRGYSYQFRLELPEELMQIAYDSGVGEKGSLGFGMIKKI